MDIMASSGWQNQALHFSESGWIVYMLDPTSCIRFDSILPKKAQIILCKTGKIQSGWLGQVLAKCMRSGSRSVSQNHQAWFWQSTTSPLPVSHFPTRLRSSTDGADHNVQNQPGSDLVMAYCARFWPNGSSLEVSHCGRIIGLASGQHF